jgi:hypothetical protein
MLGSAPSIESIHRVYRDTIAAKDAEIAAAEVAFGKERLIFCERIAALREALRKHMVVVDDWMHIYASDMCDEARVKEARSRVYEHGTLAYIAFAQDNARAALEVC